MKNLHKKLSAVALSSMVVFGGVVASGVQSFAYSKIDISDRSFIAKYKGFIADKPGFREEYKRLMNDDKIVSQEDFEAYEKVEEKIKKQCNFGYVGLPGRVEERLIKGKYGVKYLSSSFSSVKDVIDFLNRSSRRGILKDENILVRFNDEGREYKFIFYVK